MRKFFFLPLLLLLLSCSSRSQQQTTEPAVKETDGQVQLEMHAEPRQGFAPLRVTFHALLRGVSENDSNYHCLKEEWDFGNGAVSAQTPNCVPLEEGGKLETEFIIDHVYDDPGTYAATFTLGEKKLRSNKATITVLQNIRNPNGQ